MSNGHHSVFSIQMNCQIFDEIEKLGFEKKETEMNRMSRKLNAVNRLNLAIRDNVKCLMMIFWKMLTFSIKILLATLNVDYHKDVDETTLYNIFQKIKKYEPLKSAFMLQNEEKH